MVDMIVGFLRAVSTALGLLVFSDPVPASPVVMIVVAAVAIALLALAALVAGMRPAGHGSGAHPTRRTELSAPLAQSDPDAAGHVRRRGPGRTAPAA